MYVLDVPILQTMESNLLGVRSRRGMHSCTQLENQSVSQLVKWLASHCALGETKGNWVKQLSTCRDMDQHFLSANSLIFRQVLALAPRSSVNKIFNFCSALNQTVLAH